MSYQPFIWLTSKRDTLLLFDVVPHTEKKQNVVWLDYFIVFLLK
jgi:hypothetical protein